MDTFEQLKSAKSILKGKRYFDLKVTLKNIQMYTICHFTLSKSTILKWYSKPIYVCVKNGNILGGKTSHRRGGGKVAKNGLFLRGNCTTNTPLPPHRRVKPKLLWILCRMVVFHQQSCRFGAVAQAELRAKVGPEWHKMVEVSRIACHPGRQNGQEDHGAERGADQAARRDGPVASQDPNSGKG